MFAILIFLFVVIAVDGALLFTGIRPRSLVICHGVLAFFIVGACALKADFDLGPHIEIPGWIVGLIIAGLSVLAGLVAIGAWQVFAGARRK